MCALQAATERDPDSKRVRFKPNSVHGRSCCSGVNVRWLAAGFILGMLMFATLSVLQVHADGMMDWDICDQACAPNTVAVLPMLAFQVS